MMSGDVKAQLNIEDCVNSHCPWSGDLVSADSLTLYRGVVVGFCNPGCRDKFETAINAFDTQLIEQERSHG